MGFGGIWGQAYRLAQRGHGFVDPVLFSERQPEVEVCRAESRVKFDGFAKELYARG
jgi:hypothetical protein